MSVCRHELGGGQPPQPRPRQFQPLFVSLCICLQIGVWSSTSGLVVNDNNDVTKATASEAAAFIGSSAEDANTTRIVTTILVSPTYIYSTIGVTYLLTYLLAGWLDILGVGHRSDSAVTSLILGRRAVE